MAGTEEVRQAEGMVAAEKVGALQEEGTALEWTGTAAAEATGQDLA